MNTHEKETNFEGLCEWAWGIIANAGEGNWKKESNDWQEAAEKWRDNWLDLLKNKKAV